MRMACLILAYRAARVLQFAAPFYRDAGWEIFVHVDPKAGQEAYVTELGDTASLCHFVPDPVEVFWGGYSMLEAELRLISTAQKVGQFDKYLLLSDDAFPAFPAPWLVQHFMNEEDQLTIELQREGTPFRARYEAFVCYDHEATAPHGAPAIGWNAVARPIDTELEQKISEIAKLRQEGKKKLDIYYGSQFWALTSKSIELILDVIKNDRHLQKSFEYSALPDEIMLQSVLGNYLYNKRMDTGPVYVDFSAGGPRVIGRMEDLPRDLQQPHAFIRKFSPENSEFLASLAQRLTAGRTVMGDLPGKLSIVQQNPVQAGRVKATVRLTAPAQDAGPCWHGIESFWGRQYRWTASDHVIWTIEVNLSFPGTVRFVITTVISSGKDWFEGCKLSVNSRVLPTRIVGGELTAEFEHAGLQAVDVELHTPALKSPSETIGSHDTRRLGLSVAL